MQMKQTDKKTIICQILCEGTWDQTRKNEDHLSKSCCRILILICFIFWNNKTSPFVHLISLLLLLWLNWNLMEMDNWRQPTQRKSFFLASCCLSAETAIIVPLLMCCCFLFLYNNSLICSSLICLWRKSSKSFENSLSSRGFCFH